MEAFENGDVSIRMKDKGRESQQFKGTIVQAYGGHIVRSTGLKDRHSKVFTAKGLRDRRVRLSAHTAIQFYDVQDRLGYDRPSKAVDWLMQNAKAAIEQLMPRDNIYPIMQAQYNANSLGNEASDQPTAVEAENFDFNDCRGAANLPSPSSHVSTYQNYMTSMMSRDLRLSLQSLQQEHPIIQDHTRQLQIARDSGQQTFFCGAWNATAAEAGSVDYNVALAPEAVPVVGKSVYAQREPLQSSDMPTFRWVDSTPSSTHSALIPIVENLVTGDGYSGFSGFSFPARIQGNEEG